MLLSHGRGLSLEWDAVVGYPFSPGAAAAAYVAACAPCPGRFLQVKYELDGTGPTGPRLLGSTQGTHPLEVARAMATGYWIQDGYIYGPRGYTQYYIRDGHIYGPRGYTQFWLSTEHLYGPRGYTQCYLSGNHIYGPEANLPWEE
jgi:hypothetical protein